MVTLIARGQIFSQIQPPSKLCSKPQTKLPLNSFFTPNIGTKNSPSEHLHFSIAPPPNSGAGLNTLRKHFNLFQYYIYRLDLGNVPKLNLYIFRGTKTPKRM